MSDTRYWRIRIKYDAREDLTRSAWEMNQVGIWYGAWGARELNAALKSENPLTHLSKVNAKRSLKWKVPASFLNNAKRFISIEARDWVVVYFDSTLHLAHIASELLSSRDHPLNRGADIFKYREINAKKSFSLNRLPDAFRVLRSAGRGNVYQLRSGGELIKLLGQASTERDVINRLTSIRLDKALELLGPTTWESVCLAYLIIEHEFVPAGLALGGTLADIDIVGRRKSDGARILAQCKKDPHPVPISDGFLEAIADLGKNGVAFYFAYGGCKDSVPTTVRVVDRDAIHAWSKTKVGARYFSWLFGT
jgi:hypothetical protein